MRLPLPQVTPGVQQAGEIQAPGAQGFVGAGQAAGQMIQTGNRLEARSNQLFELQLREQDAFNDATSREEINAYRMEARKASSAFRQLRGLQADEKAYESAVQTLRQQRETVMGRLTNEAQKAMFAANADLIDASTMVALDEHRANETFRANYSASKARSENAIQDAAEEAAAGRWRSADGSVTNYQIQTRVAIREAESLAEMQGLGDDERKLLRQGALNAIHTQAVRLLIRQGQAKEAVAYFDKFGDQVAPAVRDDLQGLVRQSEQSDQNMASAIAIEGVLLNAAPAPDMIGPPVSNELSEMRSAVMAGEDPVPGFLLKAQTVLDEQFRKGEIDAKQHEERLRILDARMRVRMHGAAEEQRALRTEAERWLVENPNMPLSANAELFERIKRAGLVDTLRSFEENGRYVTNTAVLADLMNRPPEFFRSKPPGVMLEMYRGSLSNRSLDLVMAMHADANKVATPEQRAAVSWERRMEEAGKQLNLLPRDRRPTPKERDAYETWALDFDTRMRTAQSAGGAKFSESDAIDMLRREVSDKLTLRRPGWFYDSYENKPIGLMTQEERQQAGVLMGSQVIPFGYMPPEFAASLRQKIGPAAFNRMPPQDVFMLWVKSGMEGATEKQAREIRAATATPAPAKPPMVWPAVPENERLPDIKR